VAVLDVTCDGSSTSIAGFAVQAQSDGVHVRVENTTSDRLAFDWDGGGDNADPGRASLVLDVPPGTGKARCLGLTDDPGQPGGWTTFDVIAADGWVSPELKCASGLMSQGVGDYVAGATGSKDPMAVAKQHVEGLEVQEAGYRTDESRTFIALDEGVVTHTFGFTSDGQGGWLLTTTGACG